MWEEREMFNTKRSLAHTHATHANMQIHPTMTLPPAVRRRREVSGGVKRRDGGGREVAWTVCSADKRRNEENRKTDVAVISARPGGGGGGGGGACGCRWWRWQRRAAEADSGFHPPPSSPSSSSSSSGLHTPTIAVSLCQSGVSAPHNGCCQRAGVHLDQLRLSLFVWRKTVCLFVVFAASSVWLAADDLDQLWCDVSSLTCGDNEEEDDRS